MRDVYSGRQKLTVSKGFGGGCSWTITGVVEAVSDTRDSMEMDGLPTCVALFGCVWDAPFGLSAG